MSNLHDILLTEDTRTNLVADLAGLANNTIAAKKGMKGTLVRAGIKTLNGIKPGFMQKMINKLLPDIIKAVEPNIQQWDRSKPLGDVLEADKEGVVERILSAVDNMTKNSRGLVQSTYKKLRPTVGEDVTQTLPELGDIFSRYVK